MFRRLSRSLTDSQVLPSYDEEPEQTMSEKKPHPINTQTNRTAANALYFALQALSSISEGDPLMGVLSGTIGPLLEVTARIKQTSSNAHALAELAARIERLAPILRQIAHDDPAKGQDLVENLQQTLTSMTTDLEAANSRGKPNWLFNNRVDNASILQKYNTALSRMIANSTFVTVQEVAKSLRDRTQGREREDSRVSSQESSSAEIESK
ncbi:hypothetical protein MSAN_01390300 [Mycena sanguinolenta]|uniref:Uncharacterized protein n=1 Tax=Mycena sanguinolenta TaxID=230812 RepID=A0A8H7D0L2_9AGAR|nr:hypothetical protein MSAN_01390300 [Mycena sanguinolenta]